MGAEIWAWTSRSGVESEEACVEGRFKYAAAAGCCGCLRRVEPCGHTPIDETIAVVESLVDLRIVGPHLLSRGGFQCDHAIDGGGEVQQSVHEDRRSFKSAALASIASIGNVSGVEDPSDL